MTIDQRRDRAREWLRKIRADVQDLLLDSHVFWEVQEIIRGNPRLSAARNYFFHWLMAAHVEATVIGIRRQVKNARPNISLRRFLGELVKYPEIVSRAHHVSLCTSLNANLPARFHERTFDRCAGGGAAHVRPAAVQAEIDRLEQLTTRLEHLADRALAHHDQRGLVGPRPTFQEIDDCLAFFEDRVRFYTMLLEGVSETTLLPTFHYDWQEIFRYPWIA